MSDYYIRTPDNEASRGPFDIAKLQTLAEAGQVSENTLFYDESKEEWIPIALSEELKNKVFPPREKLSLKIGQEKASTRDDERPDDTAPNQLDVESMLVAAEGETEETKHLKQRAKSFDKAASLASSGIGLMFLASAVYLLYPHYEVIKTAITEETYSRILNYPFLLVGLFDLIMSVFLFLAITEIYPLLRGRSMITLGFGLYVGWVLGDPILMGASAVGSIGIFGATVAQTYPTMLLALLCGISGNGFLAYLAITGRFNGFFDLAKLSIIAAS